MAQLISPQALTRQREFVGMSVTQLAKAVGVTSRAVRHWEAGTRTVGDRSFGRLLDVLGCDAQDLTGHEPGTETLTDLRRAAGMSAEEAAYALRGGRTTQGLNVSAEKIRDLESGRKIRGWAWRSPEALAQVVRLLAQMYGVPDRLVMDAWHRSRPQDPLPVLPEPPPRQMSTEHLAVWQALNERQRTYLTCIFVQDQEVEKDQWRKRHAGEMRQPAILWRRMTMALSAPHSIVGYTTLQERLRQAGVHDPGAGSSMAALERRHLLRTYRDWVYIDGLGEVLRTRVEMTRRGRAAARAGLGITRETGPPAPLLSQWLWKIMIRVARAGERGVDGSLAGRGPHYLAVGQSPDGRTPSRGFIVLRHPDRATYGPYRWFLTDSGRRHVIDYLDAYRTMYPDIDTEGVEEILH
ncbi:XRE family transcriptional regulator [Nonomuraea wenchangensis]|uniref:XRE family transcriptional regulator n=1 Tax=Nonomuraea wenchangensis TaxID=568860 RepID=UPI00384A8293